MTPELKAKLRSYFLRKKTAYQQCFSGPFGEKVLNDLAKFCRANETTFVPGDTHGSALFEGRREVWIRIQKYLNLSQEELFKLQVGEE